MKLVESVLFIGLLFFNAMALGGEVIGKVDDFKGDLLILRNKVELKVSRGLELEEGDRIEAKAKASAKLIMKDQNIFILSENSKLDLKEYVSKTPPGHTTLLLDGKLLSNIKNKYKDDKPNFRLVTPSGVAGIRGTEFLTVHRENKMQVTTFEGVVEVGEKMVGRKITDSVIIEKGFQFTGSSGTYQGKSPMILSEEQLQTLKTQANVFGTIESAQKESDSNKESSAQSKDGKKEGAPDSKIKDSSKADSAAKNKTHVK